MTSSVSPNTQAVLLLTAPLIAGPGSSATKLLSSGEYRRVASILLEAKRTPADLLASDASELIRACAPVLEEARLRELLGRGFLLSQAVERWQTRAIWVMSRADDGYPLRLRRRLRADAPTILYGCGDSGILKRGGLAVVGSRHVDDVLVEYTMAVGRLAANAGKTIVSGGARGIDQAAMRGALEAGGTVIGVLADGLEKAAMHRDNRGALIDGQLALISPYDPSAGFNVGHAMQRNKSVYALADAALVVSSDVNKGGTWAGATEQLEKYRFVPVYVRTGAESGEGLSALRTRGALAWPEPRDAEELGAVLRVRPVKDVEPAESELPLFGDAASVEVKVVREVRQPDVSLSAAEVLFGAVRDLVTEHVTSPMKDVEVAELLGVSLSQAKVWLGRLVDEGVLERRKRPAAYVLAQSGLFRKV